MLLMEILFVLLLALPFNSCADGQCEPIRIEMCRGLGYNETMMPNFLGHDVQTEVDFTLQTFAPLIEYVCSSQLKLFLCAAYVPMCTPKIHTAIGPCRSLCESVRTLCHPILQGFGFPWPPALDCNRFPKENNHETMCMEGEGETQPTLPEDTTKHQPPTLVPTLQCPGVMKSHLYVKLNRSGRCAPLCEADILFAQDEKHLAELLVANYTYITLALAVAATLSLLVCSEGKPKSSSAATSSAPWLRMLVPLMWCEMLVTIGWYVRFAAGRNAAACGYDPQVPNVSLLLVDGLSNAFCAATFLLRYYFGMAGCVWWAILCFDWRRKVRRNDELINTLPVLGVAQSNNSSSSNNINKKRYQPPPRNITQSNLALFAAWGLPAFQTAAVIVIRLVDSDELLGVCYVGNQSDNGLQMLVATPLFCYWIFGAVNLVSGYLMHRRNVEVTRRLNSPTPSAMRGTNRDYSNLGPFLFAYCMPCAVLLLAIIYEFANIDVWLNVPAYVTALEGITTPLWPFLTRAFMELMLSVVCSVWIMGPKITMYYKRCFSTAPIKTTTPNAIALVPASGQYQSAKSTGQRTTRHTSSNPASYSTVSYQTVMQNPPPLPQPQPQPLHSSLSMRESKSKASPPPSSSTAHCRIGMHQMSNYNKSVDRAFKHKTPSSSAASAAAKVHHAYGKQPACFKGHSHLTQQQQQQAYASNNRMTYGGNETIF